MLYGVPLNEIVIRWNGKIPGLRIFTKIEKKEKLVTNNCKNKMAQN
jgi:hypothetical protein